MMSPLKANVHYGHIEFLIRGLVGVACYYTSFILVTGVVFERFLATCPPPLSTNG